MADTDPETEALVRQLHRELNGLTRSRHAAALEPPFKRPRRGIESSSVSPSVETAQIPARRELPSVQAADVAAKRPSPTEIGTARPLKRIQKQSSTAGNGNHDRAGRLGDSKPLAPREPKDSEGKAPRAESKSEPLHVGTKPESGWSQEQAYSAAAEAVEKARQAGKQPGRSRVKCFCNGIPWGLALPPAALHSRRALAEALQQGFDDEDLQLEAGQRLHAIMIDCEGHLQEFPSHESDAPWKAMAPEIARVYVTCR